MPTYHARVAIRSTSTLAVDQIVNVLHVDCAVLTSPPNWTSIAADIAAWLSPTYEQILATHETLEDFTVTDENYPGSTFGQGVHVVNNAGLRSAPSPALSPAECLVLQFRTAVAKRYARGWMFCPPVWNTADLTNAGHINVASPYYAVCSNFRQAYAAGHNVGSTGYSPIIFSATQVKKGQSQFTFPITSTSQTDRVHWLRSRMK